MTKESFMIEEISKELVLLLMEDRRIGIEEALRLLYTSDTYVGLVNLSTGLYAQSTACVYDYLKTELATGKMA